MTASDLQHTTPALPTAALRLACALCIAALAAGCGGSDGNIDENPAPVPGPTPPSLPSQGATACDSAPGPKRFVGPGRTHARPSEAAAAAADGDVVVILAGDYVGDVATWMQNNLTICGSGGRARLFADGQNAGGKGLWVISGRNVVVDRIEFHDAAAPGGNGAGIRAEGDGLTVINAGFYDNENGILGPDQGDLTIRRSEFARNGSGDGLTHNLDVGTAARLVVTDSFFREARVGHNLKSRALETRIENSYFMDGPAGTASHQIEAPNGGTVFLRGNLVHKGPNAGNDISVSYGAEGLAAGGTHTLTLVHNTFASTRVGGTFVSANADAVSVTLRANLFAGNGTATLAGVAPARVTETDTVLGNATQLTAPDNTAAPNFWPQDTALLNQTLLAAVADTTYTVDAPAPFVRRTITGATRRAGALQSAP